MNYEKRMNQRIYIGIVYCIAGIIVSILFCCGILDSTFFSSFAAVLIVLGAVRIIKTYRIMKNPEMMEKIKISETDERNIMIAEKARSLAAVIMSCAGATAIVILYIMNMSYAAQTVAYVICGYMILYLLCYFYLRKKY